jgi:hypothetical protein
MNKSKATAVALAALMATLSLAGCSSENDNQATTTASTTVSVSSSVLSETGSEAGESDTEDTSNSEADGKISASDGDTAEVSETAFTDEHALGLDVVDDITNDSILDIAKKGYESLSPDENGNYDIESMVKYTTIDKLVEMTANSGEEMSDEDVITYLEEAARESDDGELSFDDYSYTSIDGLEFTTVEHCTDEELASFNDFIEMLNETSEDDDEPVFMPKFSDAYKVSFTYDGAEEDIAEGETAEEMMCFYVVQFEGEETYSLDVYVTLIKQIYDMFSNWSVDDSDTDVSINITDESINLN